MYYIKKCQNKYWNKAILIFFLAFTLLYHLDFKIGHVLYCPKQSHFCFCSHRMLLLYRILLYFLVLVYFLWWWCFRMCNVYEWIKCWWIKWEFRYCWKQKTCSCICYVFISIIIIMKKYFMTHRWISYISENCAT